MEQSKVSLLLEKYEQAKAADYEIAHRAENKKTYGQLIRIKERY